MPLIVTQAPDGCRPSRKYSPYNGISFILHKLQYAFLAGGKIFSKSPVKQWLTGSFRNNEIISGPLLLLGKRTLLLIFHKDCLFYTPHRRVSSDIRWRPAMSSQHSSPFPCLKLICGLDVPPSHHSYKPGTPTKLLLTLGFCFSSFYLLLSQFRFPSDDTDPHFSLQEAHVIGRLFVCASHFQSRYFAAAGISTQMIALPFSDLAVALPF